MAECAFMMSKGSCALCWVTRAGRKASSTLSWRRRVATGHPSGELPYWPSDSRVGRRWRVTARAMARAMCLRSTLGRARGRMAVTAPTVRGKLPVLLSGLHCPPRVRVQRRRRCATVMNPRVRVSSHAARGASDAWQRRRVAVVRPVPSGAPRGREERRRVHSVVRAVFSFLGSKRRCWDGKGCEGSAAVAGRELGWAGSREAWGVVRTLAS
mmetsp:Transcript_59491/g.156720  ORF Transcript_59491/g.156720 Transcript_59491/m.156720 type:complete len:212 (+) Transcript_59491:594-1229(+)